MTRDEFDGFPEFADLTVYDDWDKPAGDWAVRPPIGGVTEIAEVGDAQAELTKNDRAPVAAIRYRFDGGETDIRVIFWKHEGIQKREEQLRYAEQRRRELSDGEDS